MDVKRLSNVMIVFVLLVVSVLIPIDSAKAYQIYHQGEWDSITIPAVDLAAYHLSERTLADRNTGLAIYQPNTETGFSQADQISDFFLYDKDTGRACFWDFFKGAYCYSNWRQWSQIVPGNFTRDGITDLLLYDTDGTARFIESTGNGGYSLLREFPNWRHWTNIVPGYFGYFDGITDLLLYDTDGTALFITTNGKGDYSHLREFPNWRHWTNIVPGYFNPYNHTDLLLYDTDGTALFIATREDSSGDYTHLREFPDWRHWTSIVPGYFSGDDYTDLLLYDTDGTALFITTNGKGDYSHLREFPDWRHWTHIVPASFNGDKYTDLLLYDSTDGTVLFITTNGKGDYVPLPINKITNLGHWTHIVPGNFIEN